MLCSHFFCVFYNSTVPWIKFSKVIYCKVWEKKMKGIARDTLEQDLGEQDSQQRVSG